LDKKIPVTSVKSGHLIEPAPGVHQYTNQVVNLFFITVDGETNSWVLIDAGMPKSAGEIIKQAEKLYGEGACPEAIYLTHGHFDHIGSLEKLISVWDVPVYAHREEFPYLTGELDYPKPDPKAGRGMVVRLFPMLFPNEGIDISGKIHSYSDDHQLPHLPGWQWIHTPGHTLGHVSFYHHDSRILIAGDALITVKQESLANVLTQKKELDGPPDYLTQDEDLAVRSIKIILNMKPDLLLSGHGMPMTADEFNKSIEYLI
jgi:glyoxylase-like metal-dependent hydrolase (beta-lactamase superfamily II)